MVGCAAAVAVGALGARGSGGVAHASEGDRALSLSANYATFTIGDYNPQGGALGIDYAHGFSDALSFRVSGAGGLYDQGGLAFSVHANAGINYVFDVLKFVPYLSITGGAVLIGGGDLDLDVHPVMAVGAGVDILRSRERSWGVFARLEAFASELTVFSAGVRISHRWGFF